MRTPRLWMAVGLVVTACSYAAEAGSEEEAELDAAAENARQLLPEVAFTVAGILSLSHYSHHPIDDEISGRWLDLYVQSFDYNRRTFLQSDIEEFSTWRTRLDDTVTQPDVDLTLAWLVHDRYLQRFGERMATIDRLLAEPMDLSTGERVQLDREEAPWATTAAELDALWSGLVREEVLRLRLGGKTHEQAVEIVQKRYRRWRRDIESEPPVDVAERYLTALAESYDPHSAWFAPATHDNFDIDMSDSVEGIGAELSSDGDYIVVNKTIPGGPAATSEQVNAGDRIIAVAQAGEPAEDVVGERIDDVVRRIRGPKGTEVQITLWPASATDPAATRVVTLVREKVKLERAQAKHEVRQIPGADGPLDVALITVPAFYVDSSVPETDPNRRSASADVRRAIEGLPAGVDAVVIDLRGNGGGSLDESIALTGLFIDQGPVVQTRTHRGEIEVYQDEQAGVAWDGPLMVLTDTHSASASEIFASAIQDYGRGLVIGAATTHGKGTVQNVYDLSRQLRRSPSAAVAGALKFTTAKFYRVNGGEYAAPRRAARRRAPVPVRRARSARGGPRLRASLRRDRASDPDVDLHARRRPRGRAGGVRGAHRSERRVPVHRRGRRGASGARW
jgi:carboxyl-terminal processing protease